MSTDFSSLDKLMEFGLGIGIANQMLNTMNTVVARTAVPGVGINPGVVNPTAPPAVTESRSYYIVNDDRVAGPMNERELEELIKKDIVTGKTFCWSPGMQGWALAENIPEVNKYLLLNSKL